MNLNSIPVPSHIKIIDRYTFIDQRDIARSENIRQNVKTVDEIIHGTETIIIEHNPPQFLKPIIMT